MKKDKNTLNLLIETERENNILFWVNDIENNQKLKQIIHTKAFQRLKNISFLGAINYSEKSQLSKKNRSRATHSLYVAALANYVSTKRGYDEDLKNHIIAAALMHDIGHVPLSHSTEPYIKEKFGYGHHEIGEKIINGQGDIGFQLKNILNKNFDSFFIKSLLNNKIYNDGGDLFRNQINIDTIDGIIRSLEYKGKNRSSNLNRLEIVKHAFLNPDDIKRKYEILDNFWKSKHFVYYNFINQDYAFISDKLSQLFFIEEKELSEDDLYSTEAEWGEKHTMLFSWLKDLERRRIPKFIENYKLEFISRTYFIVEDELELNKRYKNEKNKKTANISNFFEKEQVQLILKAKGF